VDDKVISYIKELELLVVTSGGELPTSREDVQHLIDKGERHWIVVIVDTLREAFNKTFGNLLEKSIMIFEEITKQSKDLDSLYAPLHPAMNFKMPDIKVPSLVMDRKPMMIRARNSC
jgi:hypothetical protein